MAAGASGVEIGFMDSRLKHEGHEGHERNRSIHFGASPRSTRLFILLFFVSLVAFVSRLYCFFFNRVMRTTSGIRRSRRNTCARCMRFFTWMVKTTVVYCGL